MNILFVCTGNTCRSPMAEGYLRYLLKRNGIEGINVSSAGTFAAEGIPPSSHSVQVMQETGIDISGTSSTQITPALVNDADLVIAMTPSHKHDIPAMSPPAEDKVKLLGEYSDGTPISDPFGGNIEIYRQCFASIKKAIENLFEDIAEKN